MQQLSTIVGYSGKQVVLLKKLYGFKIGEDNCCCGFLIAIVPRDINTLKTKEKKKCNGSVLQVILHLVMMSP